jgi:predicted permease
MRSRGCTSLISEIGYAARRLARSPAFTATASLTLAVGIGATVAIFALVDGVLFRPLPYPDSERLVVIRHAAPGLGLGDVELSDGLYEHYRASNEVFEEMAIWQEAFVNLDGPDGEALRVELALTTPSLLQVLGVRPLLGPGFDGNDDGGRSVLLSYGLWQRRYGGDPSVVGRMTLVNGAARRVAGVMPRDFRFPRPGIDLWMDLGFDRDDLRVGSFYYRGAARLRPGVTVQQARAELDRLVRTVEGEFPDATPQRLSEMRLTPLVAPMKDDVVGDVRTTLWLLFGAVGFVLLIACANVANLHLVRAVAREREVAVRAALGAARRDLVRYLLAESGLLAAVGGASGTLTAWAAVRVFAKRAPVDLPRLEELAVGGRALACAAVLTAVAGMVFCLLPAAGALRAGRGGGLHGAGRALTASPRRQRTQRALVAAQVALALALLVGSALMVQTFLRLARVDPGFDHRDLLTFEIAQPLRGYETYERSARFQLALLDSLRALPGVLSAGAVGGLPLTGTEGGSSWTSTSRFLQPLEAEGQPATDGEPREVRARAVTHGYFEAMGISVVNGRAPRPTDRAAAGSPVLLSANLAARLFRGASAVGRLVRHPDDAGWNTVLGVVADVREDGNDEPAPEIVYVPLLDATTFPGVGPGYLAFALRTGVPATSLVPAVRRIVGTLDARMPIGSVRTMEEIVSAKSARLTFTMVLILGAGIAATFLGTIGLYGILSYTVGQRRREIGVRVALGAEPGDVVRLVLREGVALTVIGIGAGVAMAALLTQFLEVLLYEVSPTDPATFALTAAALLLVAVMACTVPARRAARVQPVEALAAD